MDVLKIILTIIFVIVSIILTVIILMQEGKSAGLGTIAGAADTYWGKNKGRSMEGKLEKFTKILAVVFIVLALVLNLNFDRSEADAGTDSTATEAVETTEDTSADETDSEETDTESTEEAADATDEAVEDTAAE